MTAQPGASPELQALEEETRCLKLRGWMGTWTWILVVAAYWTATVWGEETRLLTLPEFGDFFAGVSAPIAFLWLVVGYYQQGLELRHNSRELSKQDEALRASVEEQRHQSEITKAQLDLATSSALEQTRALKKSMQPICDLEWEEARPAIRVAPLGEAGNPDDLVQFKLTNLGRQVTEIDLQFSEELNNEGLRIRIYPVWKPGTDIVGKVRLNTFDRDAREIKISYVDGMGDKEWQKYILRRNEFGYYDFRLESESIRRFWEKP